ncbi:hypothetical protein R1sor_007775 [Riccia sorocarpa]|uniref:Uncharacterized protein n=1 Tax=Riccia sorocarpa TaxID=122646 RepID=A0ABD3HUW2_9MARC
MDATSLGEVEKGSNLRWPHNLLRKFTTSEDGISWLEDTGDHCEEVRVQCSQTPSSRLSVIAPTDYTIRHNWKFLEVHVLLKLSDGEKVAVAEGLVTLTAPATSVNNKELGELNVGVVITQISGCVDLEILRDTSLASFSGSQMLVSWPLRRVIAKKFGRSLHSLQHNLSDEDDMSEVQLSSADDMQDDIEDIPQCLFNSKIPELGPPKKKRHYNSTVRKTPDPARRAKRTLEDCSSVIVYMLPLCYTKKSIIEEVNCKVECIGGETISKSLFYRQWKASCRNYKFHKRGAFAKYDTCVTLKLKLMEERRPDFQRPIEEERNKHMSEQMSRRNVYYAKRALAKAQPEKYLCLIHDKMDQNKTNIPRLANNMKRLHSGGSCMPLPFSFTCMLTHGREPDAFCHLSVSGLWPGDPNFTVSSLARCLQDLEFVPDGGDHTGDLSRTTTNIPLFSSLLDQSAFIATIGSEGAIDSTYFQQHGGCPGDASPGRCVGDASPDSCIGDASPGGCLTYQRKVDGSWIPEAGISLWKKVDDQYTVPDGEPLALKLPSSHPRLGEISSFISNLTDFLRTTYRDTTSEGYMKYSPVISYWKKVQENITSIQALEEENLQNGFWPQTNQGTWYKPTGLPQDATQNGRDDIVVVLDKLERELQDENNLMLEPYVGDPSDRPKRAFIPLEDITEGKFVVLRPDDDFEKEVPRVVWLGRAMGAVVRETSNERHGQFLIEWWRPRHRKSTNATNQEKYTDILVGQKDWEKDPGYFTPEWINAIAAIYSWKYRSKGGVV